MTTTTMTSQQVHVYFIRLLCLLVFAPPQLTVSSNNVVPSAVSYDIVEKQAVGTLIGQGLSRDANLSSVYTQSQLSQLRFSVVRGPAPDVASQLVTVQPNSSFLQVKSVVDRDLLCPAQVTCSLRFDVAIGPASFFNVIPVLILILDTNDHRPTFADNFLSLSIPESVATGSQFAVTSAVDADSPLFGVQRYELFPVQLRSVFDVRWRVGASSVQLTLMTSLDREAVDGYNVTLVAIDGGQPPLTGTTTIYVTVSDVNDNEPIFEQQTYSAAVLENITSGSLLATVRATDADIGQNGHVTYELGDDVTTFSINSSTGEIYLRSGVSLDRETQSVYRLPVVARDQGTPGLSATATLVLQIDDVNDNPPQLALSTLSDEDDSAGHVTESAPVGTFVALVSVSDRDVGGAIACQLEPDSIFTLVNLVPGSKYKVLTAAALDRETEPVYQLRVTCSDGLLSAARDLTVLVDDVNDNAPYFLSGRDFRFVMAENNVVGARVGQVVAADLDEGENARINYAIVGQSSAFAVNAITGDVTAVSVLDYETTRRFRFQIEARDAGHPSLSAVADVTVDVTDVNDVSPRFDRKYYTFAVEENQPSATPVGDVIATDPESGDFGVVRYFIIAADSSEPEFFQIDQDTGSIFTTRPLDREFMPMYRLTVMAGNPGYPRLTSTADVTIYVTDVNDNSPIIDFPATGNSDSEDDDVIYVSSAMRRGRRAGRIIAHDIDAGNNASLSYYMSGAGGAFVADVTSGLIYVNADLSSVGDSAFFFYVLVTDRGSPPLSRSANLTIIVNASIALPPLDDVDGLTTDATSAAASSTGNRSILRSANFLVVVVVAASTGVIAIILLVAIACVVFRFHWTQSPSAGSSYRNRRGIIYKPGPGDGQDSGSQENLATIALSTGTGKMSDESAVGTGQVGGTRFTTSGYDRNYPDFGSFGKADKQINGGGNTSAAMTSPVAAGPDGDHDSAISSDSGRGPSDDECHGIILEQPSVQSSNNACNTAGSRDSPMTTIDIIPTEGVNNLDYGFHRSHQPVYTIDPPRHADIHQLYHDTSLPHRPSSSTMLRSSQRDNSKYQRFAARTLQAPRPSTSGAVSTSGIGGRRRVCFADQDSPPVQMTSRGNRTATSGYGSSDMSDAASITSGSYVIGDDGRDSQPETEIAVDGCRRPNSFVFV